MRNLIITFLILQSCIVAAQDILNPYKDYSQSINYPDWPLSNTISSFQYSHYTTHSNPGYTGEYEIDIGTIPSTWFTNFPFLAKSYKIEVVSFPFTMPCAFDPTACIDGTSNRDLYMPNDPFSGNWGYLTREMQSPGIFDYLQTSNTPSHQTLVSYGFSAPIQTPPPSGRSIFPHTILKHTITIHCGQNELIHFPLASVSWYYDNTRGRMRYYPFINTNTSSGPVAYDIIFFPDFVRYTSIYGNTDNNYIENYSVLNYFPYTAITNASNCQFPGTTVPSTSHDFGSHVYPSDNLLISSPARSWRGKFLAGFTYDNYLAPNADEVRLMQGAKHDYFINKGYPDLDLNWINPNQKLIFNPSEVSIVSQSNIPTVLRFPSLYTFKTILGIYPSIQEINDANSLANGGPYTNLEDVPVPVNASDLIPSGSNQNDYPALTWDDPTTTIDDRYGYYYIENLGQITIEPCVKIFDAKFEVKQGGTLLFEDYTQTKNPDRFTITGTGGVIAKNFQNIQYLQNTIVSQPQYILYIANAEIYAGTNVDPSQTIATYTLETGSNVEFLAGNAIYFKDGFSAKLGSTIYAHCGVISAPSCPAGWRLAGNLDSHWGNHSNPQTKLNIEVAPNPSHSEVTIKCDAITDGTLYLSDVTGRKIDMKKFNILTNLTISHLKPGMYFIEIYRDNGLNAKAKFIKQ